MLVFIILMTVKQRQNQITMLIYSFFSVLDLNDDNVCKPFFESLIQKYDCFRYTFVPLNLLYTKHFVNDIILIMNYVVRYLCLWLI